VIFRSGGYCLESETKDPAEQGTFRTDDLSGSEQGFGTSAPGNGVAVAGKSSSIPIGISDTRSIRARRWSRVDAITIRNFKAIQEATIPLGDVTILVGPNGSGKSSVLQGVHWSARAASYMLPKQTGEMISFERLDYLPSSEPLGMAHKGELKSDSSTAATEVVFAHSPMGEEAVQATVRIRAARNKGGVTVSMDGGGAVTPYKQRVQFITAYIPGLAGLSERESILAQPALRRRAASGDAGGVLRNVLLNLRSRQINELDELAGIRRLKRLNQLVCQVHPDTQISVAFDEREDYYITATYAHARAPNQIRPLETAATGVLQVVQIFAYLILFAPKIMLIDEPDAHLHPDKQERLIEALERAAKEFETQIILTTHSPHIARAATPMARLIWMNEGKVETDDDDAIRRLLGWGGLDKAAFFFIEDEDDKPLRSIIRQWPEMARCVAICRCFGLENLPRDKFLNGLLVDGRLKTRAIVHRDRDFMTQDEIVRWRDLFKTEGVFPWVTAVTDVEGYFCDASYLIALYGLTDEEAKQWRAEAAASVSKAYYTFLEKRKSIVRVIWPNGGSPDAEKLWENAGGISPETVKGKKLLSALKAIAKRNGKDDKLLDGFAIPLGFEVAPDLRNVIELAISSPAAS
jgi:ABC-type lipoprotein export system ATPase subunit